MPHYLLCRRPRHVLSALLSAVLVAVLAAALAGATAGAQPPPDTPGPAQELLIEAAEHPEEWRTHGGTYLEQRYSTLDEIHDGNVARLGLAWTFETGTTRGLEATPLVVDGMLYATLTWSRLVALDARTGEKRWEHDPEVDRKWGRRACCDVVNRGVAYYDGKIFSGALDARLLALDAKTGELLWETVTADQGQPYTITGAPRVTNGHVIIGNGGAEYGVRGYISAYDADTGALAWRFYTVPGNPADGFESKAMERAAATWNGAWWTMGGGGTVWDSMAYDPELDLLYIGTGNGSPWNREIRSPGGGDNLYLSSIVALRGKTGEYVWHYQTTPGDSWDYTATQHILLADLEIDGQVRKVLMQAPKNGFFYLLDRTNGELLSAETYVPITWATHVDGEGRPVEVPGARYEKEPYLLRPAPMGGHNWQPMAFNPQTGLVYIPAQENATYPAPPESFEFVPERWNLGVGRVPMPPGVAAEVERLGLPSGHLLAWNPRTQKEVWRAPHRVMWNGGVLTTAGNLVFQGTGGRRFVAYRATDGEKLWEVPTSTSILASPITYQLDGVQYVTTLAGWGGAFGLRRADAVGTGQGGGLILTFALAGTKAMPVTATRERRAPQSIPSDAGAEVVSAGRALFAEWCAVCHGSEASGGGNLPDLRYSPPRIFEAYAEILLEGRLLDAGMPSFEANLSANDVEALEAFVLARRAELSGAQ